MNKKYVKTEFGLVYAQWNNEDGTKLLVFLHGWGVNQNTFLDVVDEFKDYMIILIDFLGFGKSEMPNKILNIENYACSLKNVLESFNIKNKEIILIGHSFGGRIAIKYTSIYPNDIKKVFLVSAKAFKTKGLKYFLKIRKYKVKKLIYLLFKRKKYKSFIEKSGSEDYRNAKGIMKDVFKKVVNEDLKKDLQRIKIKVYVLGSINDNIVSYEETKAIYNNLSLSSLYPFYKANHFLYLEEKDKFISILKKEILS